MNYQATTTDFCFRVAGPYFEVRGVDEVLTEDLARCTPAARAANEPMVTTLREGGAPSEWLLRCAVGGAGLAAECMRRGPIDEFELFVVPIVVGGGTPQRI